VFERRLVRAARDLPFLADRLPELSPERVFLAERIFALLDLDARARESGQVAVHLIVSALARHARVWDGEPQGELGVPVGLRVLEGDALSSLFFLYLLEEGRGEWLVPFAAAIAAYNREIVRLLEWRRKPEFSPELELEFRSRAEASLYLALSPEEPRLRRLVELYLQVEHARMRSGRDGDLYREALALLRRVAHEVERDAAGSDVAAFAASLPRAFDERLLAAEKE